MNKAYMLVAVILSSLTLFGCGSSTSIPGKPFATEVRQDSQELYSINTDVAVWAQPDLGVDIQEYQITSGSVITLLDESSNGEQVRVGVDNFSDEVLDFWMSRESFNRLEVQLIDDQDPYDQNGYEQVPDDGDVEAFLRKMTYCYRYVKKYLLKVGLVNEYLPGASAYMAAQILPKYGFKRVSRSPASAIVHDVCVYKGGPSGHGHIEIKTSKGWYYGYGYKTTPIKNRTLIACYHK